MKSALGLIVTTALQFAAAVPDPLITPAAQLPARQDAGESVLGWVSESGASSFSDLRTCDFPATLSTSGSLVQCCESGYACNFFSTCSAGRLFAASASVFCDQGFCNTGVIVPSTGAKDGKSFLGCWATSLGEEPFTMVKDIGDASIATPTASASSSDSESESESSEIGSATSEESSSAEETSATGTESTPVVSTTAAPGGAALGAKPLTGVVGMLAGLLALL